MNRSPVRSLTLVLSALLCGAVAACSNSPTSGADAAPDTAAPDTAAEDAAADAGAEDRGGEDRGPEVSVDTGPEAGMPEGGADADPDASGPFVALAPCLTGAAYVTMPRVVSTGANVYQPECLRVPAGASVQIEASTVHPLEASAAGSPANPIPSQFTTATVTFPTPGFYPFFCPEHVDQGMRGVIWVTP